MPSVIQMKNGKTEILFDLDDLLYLVEEHMGSDARHLLEDFRAQSETIARLIQEREIDRSALSTVVGIIGKTTWREINVR